MSILEWLTISVGISVMSYALVSFLYRVIKGEPLWPSLKKANKIFWDGFWGVG